MKSRVFCNALTAVAVSASAAIAGYVPAVLGQPSAERYPNRSIQLIVPWAPSGPTDVYARLIAAHLQSAWGQPVVVDNRTAQPYLRGMIQRERVTRKSALGTPAATARP